MGHVVCDDSAVSACVGAVANGARVEPGVGDCYCYCYCCGCGCGCVVYVDYCCAIVDGNVDMVECCS